MKVVSFFRLFALTLALTTFFGQIESSSAQASNSQNFGRCSIPSVNLIKKIIQQSVVQDLTAKGHTAAVVSVTIPNRTTRVAVTAANVTGLTSVTANATGTGYTINTLAPLQMPCSLTAKATIKANYKEKTTNLRKTLTSTQDVSFAGAFL